MKARFQPVAEMPSRIVLDHGLNEIRLLLQERAGALIDRPNDIMGAVVEELLAKHGLRSAAELIGRMRNSVADCQLVLESLLPGDTAFFRPAGLFKVFQNELLPDIARRNDGESFHRLRIWSAGCSTGEETYSIAMFVCAVYAAWPIIFHSSAL